jgi:hypothetical protein
VVRADIWSTCISRGDKYEMNNKIRATASDDGDAAVSRCHNLRCGTKCETECVDGNVQLAAAGLRKGDREGGVKLDGRGGWDLGKQPGVRRTAVGDNRSQLSHCWNGRWGGDGHNHERICRICFAAPNSEDHGNQRADGDCAIH